MKWFFLFFFAIITAESKTVYWFTGLPSSGKTTLAKAVCETIPSVLQLDGDELRRTLCSDLKFTQEDRAENLRRIANFGLTSLNSVDTILVSTISPLESQRNMVREIFKKNGIDFYLVYITADLATCIERDVKGLYKKALNNEIAEFTGISSPYEPPANPDLMINTGQEPLSSSLEKFLTFHSLSNVSAKR